MNFKKSDSADFALVVNFFTSVWVFLFVVCFIVHLQLFIFPQFIFPPGRTSFDVSNFKPSTSTSSSPGRLIFLLKDFRFSIPELMSFSFTFVSGPQLWRSSLTTNWSQHNCAFSSFPIPLLYSGSNSLS